MNNHKEKQLTLEDNAMKPTVTAETGIQYDDKGQHCCKDFGCLKEWKKR